MSDIVGRLHRPLQHVLERGFFFVLFFKHCIWFKGVGVGGGHDTPYLHDHHYLLRTS